MAVGVHRVVVLVDKVPAANIIDVAVVVVVDAIPHDLFCIRPGISC